MSSLPKMRFVGLYNKQKVYEGPRGGQFIRKNNYRRYLSPHLQTKIETAPFRCPLTEFALAKEERGVCTPELTTDTEWWLMRRDKEVSHMNVIRELLYSKISDKNMRFALCKRIFSLSMPHSDLEFLKKIKALCVAAYMAPPDDWIVPTSITNTYWPCEEGLYRVSANIRYFTPAPPQQSVRMRLKFHYHPDCGYGDMGNTNHFCGCVIWWADEPNWLKAFELNKKKFLRWVAIMETARSCPGCFQKKYKKLIHDNHMQSNGMYCDLCIASYRHNRECNICKKVAPGMMKRYPRYGKCHIACHTLQTCSKRLREAMKKKFRP